jgi:hypothetical protein
LQNKASAIAEGHRARGQILGNAIATLGQQIPQQVQQAMQRNAQKRRDEQLQAIFQRHRGDLGAAINEVMGVDRELGLELMKRHGDALKTAGELKKLQMEATKEQRTRLFGILSTAKNQDEYTNGFLVAKLAGIEVPPEMPREFDPALMATLRQSVAKPHEPYTLSAGQTRFGPDGQPIAAMPEKQSDTTFTLSPGSKRFDAQGKVVAEVPVTAGASGVNVGSFEDYVLRYAANKGKAVEQLTPADIEDARKRYQQSDDRPINVTTGEGATLWAKDPKTGEVRLMTKTEAMRIGATQPDTADMRNKAASRATSGRGIEAVKQLGTKIFTKVGPGQRALAVKRGVEAVFGNDPEFRTYQDSRMALAGALAVEQQGSRVSDADVKALWLPMVPDAYRDTKDSYKLKWELIDKMRGVDPVPPNKPAAPLPGANTALAELERRRKAAQKGAK